MLTNRSDFSFHSNKYVPLLENSKCSIANSNIEWPTSNKFKWVLVIAKQMALIVLLQEKEIVRVIVLYLQILLRQIWFASRHHQIKVVQSFWRRLMHFSQPSVDNARTQRKRDDFQQGGRKKRRVKSIVYYKSRGTRSIIRRKNFRECSELC